MANKKQSNSAMLKQNDNDNHCVPADKVAAGINALLAFNSSCNAKCYGFALVFTKHHLL